MAHRLLLPDTRHFIPVRKTTLTRTSNNMLRHICPFLIFILLCGITSDATAQKHGGTRLYSLLRSADSLLARRYFGANIDTLYLTRPTTRWTLKSRVNISGSAIYLDGARKGTTYNANLFSDFKTTLNASVGYLGLSVGVSINPASWAGKYKDYEFNLNSYGNRWGVDLVYHNQQSAGGWLQFNGQDKVDIEDGSLLSKTVNVNAYMAFNYRRFSFPAAFSQSYIQKRSAGSWLLGLSLMGQWLQPGTTDNSTIPMSELKSINIAIGPGYGYNLVMRRNWLLHLSAIPSIVIWSNTKTWNGREWHKISSHVPDVIFTGRAALVRNFHRNFMGLSLVANISSTGEPSLLQIYTTKWRVRAFYGWRL